MPSGRLSSSQTIRGCEFQQWFPASRHWILTHGDESCLSSQANKLQPSASSNDHRHVGLEGVGIGRSSVESAPSGIFRACLNALASHRNRISTKSLTG